MCTRRELAEQSGILRFKTLVLARVGAVVPRTAAAQRTPVCAHNHLPGHLYARLQCNDALIYGSVLPMEKIKFRRWISLHPDMGVQIDCNTPLGELAFCVVRCGSSTGVLVCVPGKTSCSCSCVWRIWHVRQTTNKQVCQTQELFCVAFAHSACQPSMGP